MRAIVVKKGIEHKYCKKCDAYKPINHFGKHSSAKSGYKYTCKICRRKAYAKYRKNPKNQIRIKSQQLQKYFGITITDYNILLQKQNNRCAICGGLKNQKNTLYFAVDHDHTTGEVRGLLCGKCNTAIGLMHDSITNLNNAINYLLKPPTK